MVGVVAVNVVHATFVSLVVVDFWFVQLFCFMHCLFLLACWWDS